MAVDNARSLVLLRKLDQLLAQTHAKPLPERVHLIRTTARRLEALLDTLQDRPERKQRKLRKRLKRLRRGAGGVRDIDVQIAALRKLKIGREQERKARLMQALTEKRSEREQGLVKALDHKNVQKLRKGLQRWSAEIGGESGQETAAKRGAGRDRSAEFDGVAASLRMFSTLSRQVRALTPENLHAYRTRCKRIRYVAEMAGETPEAKHVVEQLKGIQDVAGDWHDWQMLLEAAESLFSHSLESGLVAALRNVTNAKFVEARGRCQEARRTLLAQHRARLAKKRAQRVPAPKPSNGRRRRRRIAQKPAPEAAPEPIPPAVKAASASVQGTASSVA